MTTVLLVTSLCSNSRGKRYEVSRNTHPVLRENYWLAFQSVRSAVGCRHVPALRHGMRHSPRKLHPHDTPPGDVAPMIGRLAGTLLEKAPPTLIVDVHGIGYEVDVPMSTLYELPAVGQPVSLFAHLVVREDAQLLYGFGTRLEQRLFRELLKVSGVGARLALSILSGMSVESFLACVRDNDVAALVRVPGIGKKTAERLLVELRDRVAGFSAEVLPAGTAASAESAPGEARAQAEEALAALGYKTAEVRRLLDALPDEDQSVEQLIRAALRKAAG